MQTLDRKLLDEVVQRLVAALEPDQIYLYGSHAYGHPSKVYMASANSLSQGEREKIARRCSGLGQAAQGSMERGHNLVQLSKYTNRGIRRRSSHHNL